MEERVDAAACHEGNEMLVAASCCGREGRRCHMLWGRGLPLSPAVEERVAIAATAVAHCGAIEDSKADV